MMNATNTLTATVVTDPSEVNIKGLKTNENIIRYLNTVSLWCNTMASKACSIEAEARKINNANSYDVLRAHIEKLKLFISKISELEELYSDQLDKAITQNDHQQFCKELIDSLKCGIFFALVRACWLAISIAKDPKKKCQIYFLCSSHFTDAVQIHRNAVNKTDKNTIDETLLFAVQVKILKSILQVIDAQKKRQKDYQKELKMLQKIKEELLIDISEQNIGVNDNFNDLLQQIDSVLTEHKPTDNSEKPYELPDWVENERTQTPRKKNPPITQGKSSKRKKPKKRVNKERDQKIKDPIKPIKTADAGGFLAALSLSLSQLENRQNKTSGPARIDLSKNTTTETKNSNLSPSEPFNVEEAKRFLQERWENVENEAETNPNEVTIVNCDEKPSFTNK
ncbi:MAG: hypothetical protein AMJ43_04985 [Coxiella sp. DG_40]|nr:MAG: hypothetical protein AMJ43_04985 [Coxiella sp. DG_40]